MSKQLLVPLSLLLIFLSSTIGLAQSPAQAPVVPPPSLPPAAQKSGPTNIIAILEKARHFATFIRVLKSTQIDNLINDRLNDSSQSLTIFAPNDNAFGSLRAGTLNSFDNNQKVQLMKFHMVSSFLSMPAGFQTASNPINTEAGSSVEYPLNVTTAGNMVNITTGVVNTSVIGTIYSNNRLAVYEVDQVLLPLYFFQTHSPAPAPSKPKPAEKSGPLSPSSSVTPAAPGSTDDKDPPSVQTSSAVHMIYHPFEAISVVGFLVSAVFLCT
ncbi:hypothetical protein NMG60_11000535 [Bertholletia excelsa]